VTYRR